jgi:hypothetical protein
MILLPFDFIPLASPRLAILLLLPFKLSDAAQ